MIDEIHVENVALIREADLVPGAGLTVLTGETGAGKTALLSALKLLMGERADASAVREGSEGALVEGRMFAGAHDEEGFVAMRRVGPDGRSRARVDGSLASVRELSERVRPLIDLCGQHEHQRLLDASSHVGMVDALSLIHIFEHRRPLYMQAADLTVDIRGTSFTDVSYTVAELLLERGLI